jgi:NADPH:quinone reductase-like Zn-dependent oxidoreductase
MTLCYGAVTTTLTQPRTSTIVLPTATLFKRSSFHGIATAHNLCSGLIIAIMTSKLNNILIVGATSGIGEAFARRFHGMGKKVIITGRRANKLDALAKELDGIETRQVRKNFTHCSSILRNRNNQPTSNSNAC